MSWAGCGGDGCLNQWSEQMDLTLIDTGFIVCTIGLLALSYLLYTSDKQTSFYKRLSQEPTKIYSTSDHQKELDIIIQFLPQLSMEEIEIILQQMFGRPIRILKGRDKDGSCWLESVGYFQPEGDDNFHYEKMKQSENNKRSPIG